MLEGQRPVNLFQNLTIFYLIFVCYHSAPNWWKSYVLYGPWVHAFLVIIDFVLIPIYTIFNIGLRWGTVSESEYRNYLLLNMSIQVCILIWVPMQIYPPFLENMAIAKSKMTEYRQSIGEDDDF